MLIHEGRASLKEALNMMKLIKKCQNYRTKSEFMSLHKSIASSKIKKIGEKFTSKINRCRPKLIVSSLFLSLILYRFTVGD